MLTLLGFIQSFAQNFQFGFTNISSGASHFASDLYSMNIYNGTLYVGGWIKLAKLTGSGYTQVPEISANGVIKKIKNIGQDMYVAGQSFIINGITTNIAKYNGSLWQPITAFPAVGGLNDIIEFQGEIYGIGNVADGEGMVAKLTGGNWVSVPGRPYGGNNYMGFEVFNDELYVFGHFTHVRSPLGDPIQCNNIAKFNGTQWFSLGGAQQPGSSYIRTAYRWGQKLITSNYDIWDGVQWSIIPAPADHSDASKFITYKNYLMGATYSGINIFNPTDQEWKTVIPGNVVLSVPAALEMIDAAPVEDNAVYTSYSADGNPEPHKLSELFLSVNDETLNKKTLVFPNPAEDLVYVENAKNPIISIEVYNATGRLLSAYLKSPASLASYPAGHYTLKIKYKAGNAETRKIIKK